MLIVLFCDKRENIHSDYSQLVFIVLYWAFRKTTPN